MRKFIKQLFCKHIYTWYYKSINNVFLHKNRWYYDDYEIGICKKCNKKIQQNEA